MILRFVAWLIGRAVYHCREGYYFGRTESGFPACKRAARYR